MADYTKKVNFWERLKMFVQDIQTADRPGEEEKEMLIHVSDEKIKELSTSKPEAMEIIKGKIKEVQQTKNEYKKSGATIMLHHYDIEIHTLKEILWKL